MPLSKEVQAAVDEIRRNKSLTQSLLAANRLQGEKIAALQAKIDAIPVDTGISQEDKDALQREVGELDQMNDELESAVKANTSPEGAQVGTMPQPRIDPIPPEHDPDAPRPDPLPGTGQNGTVPLMPNSAFDPDPTGARGRGDAGQPNQPAAIETAGGFVVAGGGSTSRAPGSSPESPSSTLVVPTDPDAKGPASTADVVKSGLGDSSQNALLGNDGQPIADGPGIPGEPSQATVDAEQKRQDALNEERARREANPLNLAPAGTPQAGSQEAQGQRLPEGEAPQGGSGDVNAPPVPEPNPAPATGHDGDPNQRAPV